MNLEQFFQRLSYGELSDLSMGMEGTGSIAADQQDRLVTYTNTALRDLYARFSHKRRYIQIVLSSDRTTYQLDPVHNQSDTSPENTAERFILDSASEPFQGDLVRIVEMWVEDDPSTELFDEEARLPVGDAARRLSIRTLSYDTLYVPKPVAGAVLTIEYEAGPTPLTLPADLTQKIELSPVLETALEAHVAGQVYFSMNGEAHVAKAQLLAQSYERACQKVEEKDLLRQTETATHSKFRQGGWT